MLGVRTTVASNIFALAKLLPLLIFVAIGLFFLDAHKLAVASPPTFGGFTTSVLLVLYAFTGFEAVTIPAGEIRDPQRTGPVGLFATLAIVTSIYILIQAVYIGTATTEGRLSQRRSPTPADVSWEAQGLTWFQWVPCCLSWGTSTENCWLRHD